MAGIVVVVPVYESAESLPLLRERPAAAAALSPDVFEFVFVDEALRQMAAGLR